jgi:hypothetical protein
MTTQKKVRATAVVEWGDAGMRGVLVLADPEQNTWFLPGGGLELYATGRTEVPRAAAAPHRHVFEVRAHGTLCIIDRKEASAFARCGPDPQPVPILCADGYTHVLTCMPDLAAGYHGRADALRVNGRPAEALADYDRALALEPGRAGAYLGRALTRAERGEDSAPDQRRTAQSLLGASAAEPAALP